MFSTILKEVTGYFNRAALISGFFPSLVFWALVTSLAMDWNDPSHATLLPLAQTSTSDLLAFFAWVVFWTFLILNFQPALLRVFEGYWPAIQPLSWIYDRRRARWHERWRELDMDHRGLQQMEQALLSYRTTLCTILRQIAQPQIREMEDTTRFREALREIDKHLRALVEDPRSKKDRLLKSVLPALQLDLSEREEMPAAFANGVVALNQRILQEWQSITAETGQLGDHPQTEWLRLQRDLAKMLACVDMIVGEVIEEREKQEYCFITEYPALCRGVMPTRLGNVLKSAEVYAEDRYRISATAIWSRLQTLLPSEFANTLQDAKTSLDLMILLSLYLFLLGTLLSGWLIRFVIATNWSAPQWFAIPFGVYVAATITMPVLCIGFAVGIRRKMPDVLILVVPGLLMGMGVSWYLWTHTVADGVFDSAVLCEGVLTAWLLLALPLYRTAVEASIGYSDKIRAAFDLYRWRVLEALHLPLPSTLEEERRTWEEVCSLLYDHGRDPDGRYYVYAHPAQTTGSVTFVERSSGENSAEPAKEGTADRRAAQESDHAVPKSNGAREDAEGVPV